MLTASSCNLLTPISLPQHGCALLGARVHADSVFRCLQAVELFPATDKNGPCLLLLRNVIAQPVEMNAWLAASGLDWACIPAPHPPPHLRTTTSAGPTPSTSCQLTA